jgi:glycosyltransferase involved in cell wall biosynthesis
MSEEDPRIDVSVVIPLFNEEESLVELATWIDGVMKANSFIYEAIFVDDGSKDSSWDVITNMARTNTSIRGIRFRRNSGKSAALHVGFREAQGRVVITMDADLQDSPDEIPELYQMIVSQEYDLVSGWKKKRKDPISKTIPTKLFNWATRVISGIKLHDFNCGLKAYRKDVVKSIEVYGEMHRYIPVIAKRHGYSVIGEKAVVHYPRKYGYTKFGIERFINGFLDLMSIVFVTRYEKKPMHFFGLFGTIMFAIGFVMTVYLGVEKYYYLQVGEKKALIADNPLFYIALAVMIIGTQMFLAGFLGELISRKSSDRNSYDIRESVNLEEVVST